MVGFYDSGLGGLTILKQVHNLLPNIKTIYLADTLSCPLGEKTNEQIIYNTKLGVSFLFDKGCDLVILACNTATAVAIRELQNNWLPEVHPSKKILGIIRPVSERMLQIHTNLEINIGIMATPATIRSEFYDHEMRATGYQNIFSVECAGLADSIEREDKQKINDILDKAFATKKEIICQLDVLILACTHYPIVKGIITKKLQKYGAKENIRLLSQGIMVAERLYIYLRNHPEISQEKGINRYFVTSEPENFQKKMKKIFRIDSDVEKVLE
ncbi:MAG: aspartate/glutamate racemase family protein [candidate division SR1 bacterium]|nr:aspartate/glutamate racemase family protein [candidate division SR1 bacterium]